MRGVKTRVPSVSPPCQEQGTLNDMSPRCIGDCWGWMGRSHTPQTLTSLSRPVQGIEMDEKNTTRIEDKLVRVTLINNCPMINNNIQPQLLLGVWFIILTRFYRGLGLEKKYNIFVTLDLEFVQIRKEESLQIEYLLCRTDS